MYSPDFFRYANATGSTACARCPLGWATSQGNASAGAWSRDHCFKTSACRPGSYSTTGYEDEICSLCPAGSYSSSNASTSCSTCPPLHTTPSSGSVSAAACQPVTPGVAGAFDTTAVIVGASVGSAFFIMLVSAVLVMRRRRAQSQVSAEGEYSTFHPDSVPLLPLSPSFSPNLHFLFPPLLFSILVGYLNSPFRLFPLSHRLFRRKCAATSRPHQV